MTKAEQLVWVGLEEWYTWCEILKPDDSALTHRYRDDGKTLVEAYANSYKQIPAELAGRLQAAIDAFNTVTAEVEAWEA